MSNQRGRITVLTTLPSPSVRFRQATSKNARKARRAQWRPSLYNDRNNDSRGTHKSAGSAAPLSFKDFREKRTTFVENLSLSLSPH